jgi:hypothetical protein
MAPPFESSGHGLTQLWEHVLEHWDDEAAHRALLAAAEANNCLPFAAKRYRALSDENGERAEGARIQLDKITILALSRLEANRSEAPNTKRATTFLALGVSFLLILASAYLVTR